jgi:hypothetical protein
MIDHGLANDRGQRLALLKGSIPVQDVVTLMNKKGYTITVSQFYRLQGGKWPAEYQVYELCEFFNVTPEYLLFGIIDGLPGNLDKSDKKTINKLARHLSKKNKRESGKLESLISELEKTMALLSD